ncbi:unnamed protein product [Lactuca saligna]|uniref:HECT domain-containing protein n=1 Tax=Lactuca saligna TaxID=75948 RepID=A0AA36DZB0_LACSI|nr:unnamed protein product [Lactuca saligna]
MLFLCIADKENTSANKSIDIARISSSCLSEKFTLLGFPNDILKPGNEDFNIDNLEEYISLVVVATIKTGFIRQLEASKAGFNQVFDVSTLQMFTSNELYHLLCGQRELWEARFKDIIELRLRSCEIDLYLLTSQVNMTDIGGEREAPVRVKEVGTTSVLCPMLTSTNYTVWAMRMKVVLRIHKAWTVIDPGTDVNEEKDCLAMGLLYQALPENLIMQIGDQDSAKKLWDAIRARNVGADRV